MSRVGRDYLQTGFYTEVLFRQHGVHFIAIANNVDSEDTSTNEFAPFLNIMNEWYLRDVSRKVKAAYQTKGKAGLPTNCNAIFGYLKDPENKNHWIIDEEAAPTVRRIFQLAVEGNGPYTIAKILTAEKVEAPGPYWARKGLRTLPGDSPPYEWYGHTVSDILSKPEYMGHTVNFRTSKESYKSKKIIYKPPEEWMIFENTHEAIVDKETWELAQKLRQTVRRTDTTKEANPLTGLMYCADCGERMYNHRAKYMTKSEGEKLQDNYECAAYSRSQPRSVHKCCSHYVTMAAVRELILLTLQTIYPWAIQNKEEFAARVREESELRQKSAVKETKRQVASIKKRHAELDVQIPADDHALHIIREDGARNAHVLKGVDHTDEEVFLPRVGKELHITLSAMMADHSKASDSVDSPLAVQHLREAPIHLESFSRLCHVAATAVPLR